MTVAFLVTFPGASLFLHPVVYHCLTCFICSIDHIFVKFLFSPTVITQNQCVLVNKRSECFCTPNVFNINRYCWIIFLTAKKTQLNSKMTVYDIVFKYIGLDSRFWFYFKQTFKCVVGMLVTCTGNGLDWNCRVFISLWLRHAFTQNHCFLDSSLLVYGVIAVRLIAGLC